MDLPDCPPGAEGYQDTVTEVPKKMDDSQSTKAEQEFLEHLNSLKIKVEDGTCRCMVERQGRDVSGKWIYLCYPCSAMCSGETILQTHISGKKHKSRLSVKTVWPLSIFDNHPYNQNESSNKLGATPKVLQKMAEEVEIFNQNSSDLDSKYNKLKNVRCHIQDTLNQITAPLIGVEYLLEHPPQEAHHEPRYICTLCSKQGHPRTIVNHMTCFWHRHNYIQRHFPKACNLLKPYRSQTKYREGVIFVMNRIAQRIDETYGRMMPVNIDKEEYEKDKDRIHQWLFKSKHFCETKNCTFEEVVDTDLIETLDKSNDHPPITHKDPSPPIVAVPKPYNNNRASGRRARRPSIESLSDLSDELERISHHKDQRNRPQRHASPVRSSRYEPYPQKGRDASNFRSKFPDRPPPKSDDKAVRPPNYPYKLKLAEEKRQAATDAAKKTLAYHEKNPEKHPLYPEEWKKFWNRRYKEIQNEGKDPSKHDFKPEWIVFWTSRMKELHVEELQIQLDEIYRKMSLTPPHAAPPSPPRASPDRKDKRRTSVGRKRTPPRRGSQEPHYRRSPEHRRRSPEPRRRSPDLRHRSPQYRREPRSPNITHRRFPPVKMSRGRSRSPIRSMRSPPRTNIILESRGSRSPLSRRETAHRNRSPVPRHRSRSPAHGPRPRSRSPGPQPRSRSSVPRQRSRSPVLRTRSRSPPKHRNRSPNPTNSLQTVLISDDELKPDDGLSPWNSDNDLDSLGSLPDAKSPAARPMRSPRTVRPREEMPDNVVATLRMLVALEDYLGSLGPKIIDLLAEAIKMEKEKANSSEELLERETAVVLLETAKEKLKGAAQAGLVASAAAPAVRAAVVRAAATLHEADKRARAKAESKSKEAAVVPVAGVGEVDRAQIAQQMAAALVAQGKTDVSSEELAQLVDAVVGMAEAKKREADEKKLSGARPAHARPQKTTVGSSTASALQMLQFAYDDKKSEKEGTPDAMDGLSDSDLETLLKNFNELSAEEQHSLIAYLKKLEAREPQRVERLRQYVSAAARNAPVTATAGASAPTVASASAPAPATAPAPAAEPDVKPVAIESDDDDYTVEDVFKSVTEKVNNDKRRQEMEIVKKSLEESKQLESDKPAVQASAIDVIKNMTSAADLLALVQASLQSTQPKKPVVAVPQVAEVVSSSTQPRLFGDKPENSTQPMSFNNISESPTALIQSLIQEVENRQKNRHNQHEGATRVPQNIVNIIKTSTINDPLPSNQQAWDQNQNTNAAGNRGPQSDKDYNNYTQDSYNQGARQDNFYGQEIRAPQDNLYNQGGQGPINNAYKEEARGPQDNPYKQAYKEETRGPQDNHYKQAYKEEARGPQDNPHEQAYKEEARGPQDNPYKQGGGGPQNNSYNQGLHAQQATLLNQGDQSQNNYYNKGGHGAPENYNDNEKYNQGTQGPENQRTRGPENYNQGAHGPPENYNQGRHGPQDNYNQAGCGPQDNYNHGGRGPQDNYNKGNHGPSDNSYNQGQRGQQNNYHQGIRGPQNNYIHKPTITNQQHNPYNQGGHGLDNVYGQGNRLDNSFNQGDRAPQGTSFNMAPRGQDMMYNQRPQGNNFNNMNTGRMHDNYDIRPHIPHPNMQQYNNFDPNRRGRGGRGIFMNRGRGRGRGGFN